MKHPCLKVSCYLGWYRSTKLVQIIFTYGDMPRNCLSPNKKTEQFLRHHIHKIQPCKNKSVFGRPCMCLYCVYVYVCVVCRLLLISCVCIILVLSTTLHLSKCSAMCSCVPVPLTQVIRSDRTLISARCLYTQKPA